MSNEKADYGVRLNRHSEQAGRYTIEFWYDPGEISASSATTQVEIFLELLDEFIEENSPDCLDVRY